MTTTTVKVSFEPDSEGFTSRACPECGGRFKIAFGKGSPAPLAFCPFCRHEGARWETPEQIEYGKAFAARQVVKPHFDRIDQSFRDLERAGGRHIKVKVTGKMPDLKVPPKPPERVSDLPERSTFACCGETILHDTATVPRHCVICGTAIAA